MPISKNIPMALNKSSDERLLKLDEMTDAQNITVSTDSDGNGFVLKNARGNTPISPKNGSQIAQDANPGAFEVLGSCVDAEANTLYFIVYDGSGSTNHAVYRIDFNNSPLEYEKVLANRYLLDGKPEFVDMDVIRADVNQAGTIVPILYMTDNISEPKKINVNRAISANYQTNDDIQEFLSVAKTKPVHEFTIQPRKDDNFKGNFVYGKSLSFAIQWVYQDGERSALSNISDCIIPQTVLTLEEDGSRKDDINYYEISIDKGDGEVKQINVYYRDNETGLMYLSDRLQRNQDLKRAIGSVETVIYDESASTYRFYGDRDQEPAALIETNKLFDNVPLRAKTQCIADGRLMYGNYREGRELPDVKAEFEVVYNQPYNDNHLVVDVERSNDQVGGYVTFGQTQSQTRAIFDFARLPSSCPEGTTVNMDFSFFADDLTVGPTFITTASNTRWLMKFDMDGETWHLGRKSPAGAFYPIRLKDLQDITFKTSYTVPSGSISRGSFLNNLRNQLNSQRVTVKYNNPGNNTVISIAVRDDNGGVPINVNVTAADLEFKVVASVVGDTIVCDLEYVDAVDDSITVVKVSAGTVGTNTAAQSGGSGNEEGFVGANTATPNSNTSHAVRSNSVAFTHDLNQFKTFKRGANHTFGMIFYDSKGRSSFVKELGSVYVETKGERGGVQNGKASIKIKFPQVGGQDQTLPAWVSKYQIVYGGSDIEDFKQYTVSGGFANYWSYSDFDSDDSKEDASKNIYVSLKGWSGSKASYTGENGASHVYNPKEGDILRVVRFDISNTAGEETRFHPDNLEFPVVGKTTLRKDVVTDDINLIRAEQEYEQSRDDAKQTRREKRAEKRRRKGKKGPGLLTRIGRGFDKLGEKIDDIQEENPFLDRMITTRREKREDLEDAAEDAIDKMKDTPISARNPVFPGGRTAFDSNGNPTGIKDMPMAKGDFLILKDPGIEDWGFTAADQVKFDGNGEIERPNPHVASDGVAKHWFAILKWARNVVVEVYTPGKGKTERVYVETPEIFTYGTSLPTAGIDIKTGDVWLKRVPLKYNKKETNASNIGEDHYFRYWDMEGQFFKNSYIESEQGSHYFPSDAGVFGRSHFVNKYAAENHRRHSITYSDRYSSDSPFLNLSNFNLSRANFVDLDSSYGGIDRLFSSDGSLSCIQSGKVSRLPLGQVKVQLGTTTDSLTSADTVVGTPTYYAGEYGTRGKTQMSVAKDGNIFFTDLTSKKVLRVTGNGIVPISDIGMDSFFQTKIEQYDAQTNKPRVFMGYDPDYNEVLVAFNSVGTNPVVFEGFVASFNVSMNRWTSIYDFSSIPAPGSDLGKEPTLFANIGNRFISCLYTNTGGSTEEFIFYEHKEGVTKANYYGHQKSSVVEVVANENPSMVKVFESVGLESDRPWVTTITTSDQNTSLSADDYDERERGYYAMMPRDESSNSTSHKVAIPVAVAQNTVAESLPKITFDAKINRLNIPPGSKLYNITKDEVVTNTGLASGNPMLVTSVSGNQITLGGSFAVNNVVEDGDILYVLLDQKVYGDAIRDYFCKIKLNTNLFTNDVELYAINTHYDRSKLGQEKR